ncbi:MAG: hypothetical protein K2Q18_17400 [Bdellovibrionales bacterium]|nr:hypothetical protein [Bdellovibrionales bacterium]
MNGISSNLKEEIKKSKDSKNKDKFKFIASVILTNIMVALLCLPEKAEVITKKFETKTIHKDFQIIILPVTALVDETSRSLPETLVSLVNKDKKIISEKAYLHDEVSSLDGITKFKVEIPSSDLTKVGDLLTEGVLAVPFIEKKKIIITKKRGSKYEINL